jgi:signal transduction histidine kinase
LIRQLQPEVNQIFVVSGAAAIDAQMESSVRQQFEAARSPFTFTYLSGLRTEALEQQLAALPPRSAVYYTVVDEDGDGRRVHPLDYLERMAAIANAPTYCWVDSAIGRGALGGSLYSQKNAIQRVGQLALRVLAGEHADTIPLSTLDPNTDQVDWREVRRWGISEARIPTGTIISFRDPTVWDTYKLYIIAAAALVAVQTSLIAGLLVQRRRRRRAEQELRGSQRELRRSFDRNRALGARLLMAQDGERARIARELHDDICQRMLVLTIELETVGRSSSDSAAVQEAVAVAQDISRSLHELSHRLHPTRLGLVGIVGALDHLVSELSRGGFPIVFTHDRVPAALPTDVMLCLFRVAQEGLHNAVKYSRAKRVSVRLLGTADAVTLTIIDDGVGFDVDGAWTRGLGLLSMAERLETLRGSLVVWSRAGQGTRITAVVSIDGAEKTEPSADPPAIATI